MWLSLTETNGRSILVDMDKVSQVSHSIGGANLFFNFETTTEKGQRRQKTLKVKQTVSQIAELLDAPSVEVSAKPSKLSRVLRAK
ncbi:hypothetical protein J3U99_20060 [Brucella pituitosa]|uniref:hypothetical protein n=1 Tax=Brucella TaxID=234 RepID=UPI000CFEA0F8|nr:hypothetical protein [Brucella pituitosa]MCK4207072.1 hypothetical protein [Brucella pituitosa]PRA44620.1 hypothetical protein CQ062_24335 [Ochrobactrum sp. MYb68]